MSELTASNSLPENVSKYLAITLLGEAFSEVDIKDGSLKIRRGYIYEGVKYYEQR